MFCAARSSTIASPIPLDAPVTSAEVNGKFDDSDTRIDLRDWANWVDGERDGQGVAHEVDTSEPDSSPESHPTNSKTAIAGTASRFNIATAYGALRNVWRRVAASARAADSYEAPRERSKA